jgi:hypothetical protein
MRKCILLFTIFGCAAQARATDPDLSLSTSFEGSGVVRVDETVVLTLGRSLSPDEGRIVVLVGDTDWTSLFEGSGDQRRFQPRSLTFPAGTTELVVYLVSHEGSWDEIGRFPLRVLARGELEVARVSPTLDASLSAQLAEGHDPEENAPLRKTFQDLTLQAALETEHGRGSFRSRSSIKVLGATNDEQALRFGDLGQDAPNVDLAGYAVELEQGPFSVALGDVTHGANRLLIDGFGSRGTRLALRLGRVADVSVASIYGTQLVGWDEFLGFTRSDHRLTAGSLGLELSPTRPGGVRVEASVLNGAVLPLQDFNQGVVNDAERSDGYGLRVIASDARDRLRFDGAFARSSFTNPSDPTLEQGADTVGVEDVTQNARYAEVALDVLQNRPLNESSQATLTLLYRHRRADPLYRSVATQVASDQIENVFGLDAFIGALTAQYSHVRFEDNLDEIASILKTLTRVHNANLAVPFGPLASPYEPSPFLPVLTYTYSRVHQFGADVPTDGGFDPSHIPDQISQSHDLGLSWQDGWFSVAYNFNATSQDNRQPGREDADFNSRVHGLSFGVLRGATIDLSLDLALEMSESLEEPRVDTFERVGFTLGWIPPSGFSLLGSVSTAWNRDDTDTSTGRNIEASAQGAWRFTFRGPDRKPSGTLFIRAATQRARAQDLVFALDEDRSAWQLQAGFTLSAF